MTRSLSLAFVFSTLVACAAQEPSNAVPSTDELAGEAGDGDAAKADAAHDTFGYLAVHKNADPGNPLYGAAYTLARANRTTTMCNDNKYHASCSVHDITWGAHGLAQSAIDRIEAALDAELDGTKAGTQVLVKGVYRNYVDFTAFEPSEIWVAQLDGGSDAGTFVQVFDRGIRCVTAPCPQLEELKLNSTKSALLDGLDYARGTKASLESEVYDATTSTGVIVVGDRETGTEGAFKTLLRTAGQIYLPAK